MLGQASIALGATFENRYEVLAELGSGGFGTVYRARQLATGQIVAIKVLRWQEQQGPARDRKLARFLREMRLCARLHHPNIVRLIDCGTADGGAPYTVFDFVPGENLADVLAREGALDPVEARHLMSQVLDALACAHDAGIVHRDLKPKNIMVTAGARRNALVLDFGIGAITGADDEEAEDLTATGEMLGSPGYAAPEQFLRLPPTPRSDLFSWALVLLECLTGVPAEPVHRRVLQRLDPEPIALPPPIDDHRLGQLLRSALVKDVSAREVTAHHLLRQLESCDLRDLPPLSALAREPSDTLSGPVSRRVGVTPTRGVESDERTPTSGRALLYRERRQVTAVCCKIEVRPRAPGPESLEDADEQLDFVQRLMADVARRLGGWICGTAPDTLVVCFGYPSARGDDAQRAAQAALAMDLAVRQRAASPGERSAQADVSIGVHTGLVIARRAGEAASALGPLVGATLRTALEIARSAQPGSVLVSAETRRLTEAQFEYAQAPTRLDACGVPVEAFALQAARSGVDVPAPTSIRQTPLVGRERDLALLVDLSEKTRRGFGQSVLVHGEAGIGKSRLAREFVRQMHRDGFTVLEGRSTPESTNRALHPFIDMLERTLELGRADGSPVPAGEKLRRVEAVARSYGLDLERSVALLATLLGVPLEAPYRALDVSPVKLKELTRETILTLLLEMADTRPVILLLEDLHWSDATTRELLGKITAEVAGAPLLVVMTARPEFVPPWSPSSVTSLALGRLERVAAEELVSKVAQGMAIPSAVLDRIVDRADGVPLFVEELVSTLIGSGELVPRSGRYELAKPLADVNVPTTLRASLTARLDRLGRAKQTAQLAAVIGREFRLDVLLAASSASDAEVRQDLEALIGAELVHGRRRRREALYSFKHALVRDAAYELLARSERQEAHATVARVLEERFADVAETRPELLARHHAAAHQMPQAIAYAKRAAAGALQRSANAEVIAVVTDAFSWLEGIQGATERATAELELNSLLTMAQMATHGYGAREVAQAISRSQELLPLVGEGPLATGTRWAALMYHHLRAERKQARALAVSLVGAARDRRDHDQLAAALPMLGQCSYLEGRLVESRDELEQALALYDPERHRSHALMYGLDSKAYAQSVLALVLWLLGDRDAAWEHGRAAVAWARELGHAPTEAVALLYLSGLPHYEQDKAKVIEMTGVLNELVDRYGLLMFKAFCGVLHGWAAGDLDLASKSLDAVRATGQEIGLSYWLSLVAECEAACGAHAGALARVDEALAHAHATGELYYVADLHRLKGAWLLAQRRRDGGATGATGATRATDATDHETAAEASLRLAVETARRHSERPAELRACLALGELLEERGLAREARDLVAEACNRHDETVKWPDLVRARSFVRRDV